MSIAIIGAGFGGVGAAVRLHRAGFTNFTVFEKSAGPGGTWWDNTYPGAEVDVNSFLYSFSFMPYQWARSHARQPDLQQYFEDVLDHFAIRDRFRFSSPVEEVTWDEARSAHVVRLESGDTETFDVVISCVGLLNVPKYPTWPGLDTFEGPKFHTSRWEHHHDLTGKRVAIVGTGSTSSQLTPAIAPIVDHLYVFQREPAWILPKGERDFSEEDRARYRSMFRRKGERYKEFRNFTKFLGLFVNGSETQAELRQMAIDFIEREISDPELRAMVTPQYPFGCKRIVLATTFYGALTRDNVTLVPRAVERVTPNGVVDVDGAEREIDVLVMATGFQATNFLAGLQVRGLGGRDIHQVWGDDPQALLGSTVPGFPNFFMLYGPNTNGGGSIVYQLERQAEMVVRSLKRMHRREARVIDTRPETYRRYNRWIEREVMRRMDASQPKFCNNYYFSRTGRNVTQWPRSAVDFNLATRVVPTVAMFTRP